MGGVWTNISLSKWATGGATGGAGAAAVRAGRDGPLDETEKGGRTARRGSEKGRRGDREGALKEERGGREGGRRVRLAFPPVAIACGHEGSLAELAAEDADGGCADHVPSAAPGEERMGGGDQGKAEGRARAFWNQSRPGGREDANSGHTSLAGAAAGSASTSTCPAGTQLGSRPMCPQGHQPPLAHLWRRSSHQQPAAAAAAPAAAGGSHRGRLHVPPFPRLDAVQLLTCGAAAGGGSR